MSKQSSSPQSSSWTDTEGVPYKPLEPILSHDIEAIFAQGTPAQQEQAISRLIEPRKHAEPVQASSQQNQQEKFDAIQLLVQLLEEDEQRVHPNDITHEESDMEAQKREWQKEFDRLSEMRREEEEREFDELWQEELDAILNSDPSPVSSPMPVQPARASVNTEADVVSERRQTEDDIQGVRVSHESESETAHNDQSDQFELKNMKIAMEACKELSMSSSRKRASAQMADPGLLMPQSVKNMHFGKSYEIALEEVLKFFEGLHAGTPKIAAVKEAWRVGIGESYGTNVRRVICR